jgi:hypothetical protein
LLDGWRTELFGAREQLCDKEKGGSGEVTWVEARKLYHPGVKLGTLWARLKGFTLAVDKALLSGSSDTDVVCKVSVHA